MAKNAEMLATTKPKIKCGQAWAGRSARSSTHNSFKPARAMAGKPSRKENRAASSRLKFRNSAAVNVEPERDTPGINAPICATPTIKASRRRIWLTSRVCRARSSATASSTAITTQEMPITISPRKGELHAFKVDDNARPAMPIGTVASTIATASLNQRSL